LEESSEAFPTGTAFTDILGLDTEVRNTGVEPADLEERLPEAGKKYVGADLVVGDVCAVPEAVEGDDETQAAADTLAVGEVGEVGRRMGEMAVVGDVGADVGVVGAEVGVVGADVGVVGADVGVVGVGAASVAASVIVPVSKVVAAFLTGGVNLGSVPPLVIKGGGALFCNVDPIKAGLGI